MISLLKKLLDNKNLDGYIIPKNDEFFSEYSFPNRLKLISSFSGSAGLAVILKNKNLYKILVSQKKATENVFNKKKIPFRSFNVHNRNEETMGELFSFFILETILLGQLMKVNPFDQPSVELIKKETVKILR